MYKSWGFRSSPFQTSALPASEAGHALLVGRDAQLESICRRLKNGTKAVTIEGVNGVGKTSIANVASFLLSVQHSDTPNQPFYLPCRKIFQLTAEVSPSQFRRNVLIEVAQTLFDSSTDLPIAPGRTKSIRRNALARWLNSPESTNLSATFFNFGMGGGNQPNSTSGFSESGIEKLIVDWLEELFPNPQRGAVICVIDNLELLRTSVLARQKVEELRDELFALPGIRWILCGALGVVNGAVNSPRLEGYLHHPIEINDIHEIVIPRLLAARIQHYARPDRIGRTFLPIGEGEFLNLFKIFRGNLRTTLSYCDDFCHFFADEYGVDERMRGSAAFYDWLLSIQSKSYGAFRRDIDSSVLQFFRRACQFEVFSLADRQKFGINTVEEFQLLIQKLVDENLLTVVEDLGVASGKSFEVAPRGWLVEEEFLKHEFVRRIEDEEANSFDDPLRRKR